MKVRATVEAALGEMRRSTKGWYRGNCPVCIVRVNKRDTRSSLAFRQDSGFYYCLRCGVRGFVKGRGPELDDTPQVEDRSELGKPEGFIPLGHGSGRRAMVTKPARDYLLSRNVTPDIWQRTGLGVVLRGKFAGRIIVPLLDADGEWIGWIGRLWEDGREGVLSYRYPKSLPRGTHLWNAEVLLKETDEPAALVEGVFDALPHTPTIDVAAGLGKPTKDQLPLLLRAKRPVVIVLDGDAWREGRAVCRLLQYKKRRAAYVRMPPKTDPGNRDPGELRELAARALRLA